MAEENFDKHNLLLENRQSLEMTGIKNVDAFNEEEIVAVCDYGQLLIKGEKLHVEVLDLTTGDLKIVGKITALVYSERTEVKGFFKKVFS